MEDFDIRKIVAQIIGCEYTDLDNSSQMSRFPMWDSEAQVEIILLFEEKFNLEIPDSQVQNLTTIGELQIFYNNHIKYKDGSSTSE